MSLPLADDNTKLAQRVYELLGKPNRAKDQFKAADGKFCYGRLKSCSRADFVKHVNDAKTIALCPIKNGVAVFVCWDIDAEFGDLLPVFRKALKGRGLLNGCFLTGGSTPGRGKVVLCLEKPLTQDGGVHLAADVLLEVSEGRLMPPKVDTFPRSGQGGVVRIGGRNRERAEVSDPFMATDEKNIDTGKVRPVLIPGAVEKPARMSLSPFPPLSLRIDGGENEGEGAGARVQGLLSEPYRGDGKTIFGDMLRIAHHVRRTGGERSAFEDLLDKMLTANAHATEGTRRQLAERSARDTAWSATEQTQYGSDELGDWRPLTEDAAKKLVAPRTLTRGRWRAYQTAAACALHSHKNPHCLPITYTQAANVGKYADKSAAREALDSAEQVGLLLRLDRGEAVFGTKLFALFTIVGQGETLQQAFDAGVATEAYNQRLKDREAKGLPPPKGLVRDNVIVFPSARPLEMKIAV